MGLQDVCFALRLPFDSDAARELSTRIAEEIYLTALESSTELAKQHGPHPAYEQTRAARKDCPRCGRPGRIRAQTGWCGTCSRPRQPKQPPRTCAECGRLRRHAGLGLCSACLQKHPDRPFVRGENLAARLADPPDWLGGFVAHLAQRNGPSRACTTLTALGRLLGDEHPNLPQALLERARRPGRSMGALARGLEDFFTEHGLIGGQRRLQAVPEPLRPQIEAFNQFMLHSRERARRAGTRPRSDQTLEIALATMRDLGAFLQGRRGKQDWALADVHDIEAFLATAPKGRKRRLTVLRQFFAFARARRIVLADPTRGLSATQPRGFSGQTLLLDEQRRLFRRWTTESQAHPHEALLGMLALIHGVSSQEVRLLRLDDIDHTAQAVRLGQRPHPVPLDPASWADLQRCVKHRAGLSTANPHLLVTRGTKSGRSPASRAYMSHVLDPSGVAPRMLRSTRLVDLVNTMDPKLVAAAFGMTPEAVMIYLADHIDPSRLDYEHERRR
jgi:integrase